MNVNQAMVWDTDIRPTHTTYLSGGRRCRDYEGFSRPQGFRALQAEAWSKNSDYKRQRIVTEIWMRMVFGDE